MRGAAGSWAGGGVAWSSCSNNWAATRTGGSQRHRETRVVDFVVDVVGHLLLLLLLLAVVGRPRGLGVPWASTASILLKIALLVWTIQ